MLAKVAYSSPEWTEVYMLEDCPLSIQKCIFLDRVGNPYHRTSCK